MLNPYDQGMHGDHRLSCQETYGKNPHKAQRQRCITQIKHWNPLTDFTEIFKEYEINQHRLESKDLDDFYYCSTCISFRPVDVTVIKRDDYSYIWCWCGAKKVLTIPQFNEFHLEFFHNQIERCKKILINYQEAFFYEIPIIIYFGAQITPFLIDPKDIQNFVNINLIYQENLHLFNDPQEYKYQLFLRQMLGL